MKTLLLGDNRILAWENYGAADAYPVFYFHGLPGSRIEASSAHTHAQIQNLRLIACDRPGYGDSTEITHQSFSAWSQDVAQLADRLGLQNFSIVGFSGGAPYALACANYLKDRVDHVSVVSSPADFSTDVMQQHFSPGFKPLYELAAVDYQAALDQINTMAPNVEAVMALMQADLPPADQQLFSDPEFAEFYRKNLTLSIQQGAAGAVENLYRLGSPWPFKLQDISTPVSIWHSLDDRNCGIEIGRYLAERLPETTSFFLENSAHFFIFKQWPEILEDLGNHLTHGKKQY